MKRTITMAALAVCTFAEALAAQTAGERDTTAVLRRADRRALIIRDTVEFASATPISTTGFELRDATRGTTIRLAHTSVVGAPGCPSDDPTDLLCIELLDPQRDSLDDTHTYVLFTDSVHMATGIAPRKTFTLHPVRAEITHEIPRIEGARTVQWITIDYSRETRSDSSVLPKIAVNGAPIRVLNEPCLRGNLDFGCHIDHVLHNGDRVSVQLVDRRTGRPVIEDPAPLTVRRLPPKEARDANLVLTFAYARKDGEPSGSLSGLLRSCRLSDEVRICPEKYFGGLTRGYEVLIHPYADVQLNLAGGDEGHWTVGPQVQGYFYDAGFELVDLRLTPKREASQDGSVTNWIPADVEARLYVRTLANGPIGRETAGRAGGSYRLIPRFGYEYGFAGSGADSVRTESRNPSRGKLGLNGRLFWPRNALGIAPEGLTLEGDWMLYVLRRNPDAAEPIPTNPQVWSVSLTLNMARNFGVTAIRRGGRAAPLFRYHNALEIGATYLR